MTCAWIKVFRKELAGYFITPIAYIVISVFLVLTGWFFFSTFFIYGQAELRSFFSLLPLTFAFMVPAVTMRLFSEEFNTGSHELMLTMPVSTLDVVLGKFAASAAFVGIMLMPTLMYPICISFIGELDMGPVIGGYAGALLLGAAYSSVGLLASSLTRNQIIAFMLGTAACVFLTLIDKMLFFMPEAALGALQYLGADYHFRNIAKGVLDSRDIIYFASVCFAALYGALLSVQEKS